MQQNSWLHRYATLVAVCTLFLVIAGASVTSKEAGLSVPDWPLSYGQVIPEMTGGVLFETGHRMIATVVGTLTIILAIWIARVEKREVDAQAGLARARWSGRAGTAGRRDRASAAARPDQHRPRVSGAALFLGHRRHRRVYLAKVAARAGAGGRLRLAVFPIAGDSDSGIGAVADRPGRGLPPPGLRTDAARHRRDARASGDSADGGFRAEPVPEARRAASGRRRAPDDHAGRRFSWASPHTSRVSTQPSFRWRWCSLPWPTSPRVA